VPVAPEPAHEPVAVDGTDTPRGVLGWLWLAAKAAAGVAAITVAVLLVIPSVVPYDAFFVRTGSMTPTLPVGSLVLSHRVPASSLREGDVISFVRPGTNGGVVTHRIVEIEHGPRGVKIRTQGDRNPEPDTWIVDGRGEGWRMIAHVSKVGYAVGVLRDGLRHRTVLLGVTGLLGLLTLVDIWRRPTIPARRR
jgi:signal peptidase